MPRPRTTAAALLVATLGPLLGGGACERGEPAARTPASPDAEMARVVDAFRRGELDAAYVSFLPESYRDDLESLLVKAKRLVRAEDFPLLQQFVRASAKALLPVLEAEVGGEPGWEELAARLEEPLPSLRLSSFEEFRGATIGDWLAGIERLFLGDWLRSPHMQEAMGRHSFAVLEREGDYVKLAVTSLRGSSNAAREDLELVRVGERWIPPGIAGAWKARLAELERRLDDELERRDEDPGRLGRILEEWDGRLGELAGALPDLLARWGESESVGMTEDRAR